MIEQPGRVVLFGSGETSASGRRVFDWLLSRLSPPIRVAILETPAGFEPNSDRVAGRIADFLHQRLQNYNPQTAVIPARKRGTRFSPDEPALLAPLLRSNVLFLGPGSPTYAVRQLQDSLAWHVLTARHRLGAAVVLASAASIAASRKALPVYEIYKVGQDLHWQAGLDLLAPYGLSLVVIPHWNNNDGGDELDTRRCYMGQARFERLLAMLPPEMTIVGIDEHTALVMEPAAGACRVIGQGGVTLLRGDEARGFASGGTFAATEMGPFRLPQPQAGIPPSVWQEALAALADKEAAVPEPPPEALALAEEREAARKRRDWPRADALRERIGSLGWQVQDTPQGPQLQPLSTAT